MIEIQIGKYLKAWPVPSVNKIFLCLFFLYGCVEPYQFEIKDNTPLLVVEGFVSNVSYLETLEYPSDGRFFSVKLSYTSDVTNVKGEAISGASVHLESRTGESWSYTEDAPGNYLLLDKEFKAERAKEYRIFIMLPAGDEYASDWQEMPEGEKLPIGEVSFIEQTRDNYIMAYGEQQVRPLMGIAVFIDLPPKETSQPVYYRWDFEPVWVYKTPPPPPPVINPTCWVRSQTYLNQYTLQLDQVGGYKKELFFVETINNDRFYQQFSLLIRQFKMNEGYYQFWNEMQTQVDITFDDSPPYNLNTNMRSLNSPNEVVGYFGVVQESAVRWYFNVHDLSYYIPNPLKEICKEYGGESCYDCLYYPYGEATLEKPTWWLK